MIAGRDFVKFCKQPGHNLTAILMINKDVDKDKSLSVHWSLQFGWEDLNNSDFQQCFGNKSQITVIMALSSTS